MITYRHTAHVNSTWSRRRWLASMGGLLFGAWLFPINLVVAQPRVSQLHEDKLRIFVDTLLPADDLTPAASAIEVHTQILKDAAQDSALRQLIEGGCQWLQQSVGSLADLDSSQLERLLQAMSDADWNSGPKNFFYQMRDRAMMYYYADPRAWAGSAINRPPQPIGYPEVIHFK